MVWVALALSFATGMVSSMQGVVNGVGSKAISTSWMIIFISLVQVIPVVVFLFIKPSGITFSEAATGGWKWFLVSGVLGVINLAITSYTIPRAGALITFVIIILGQIICATLVDQFGLFGMALRSVSPIRYVSIAVILTGVLLLLFEN